MNRQGLNRHLWSLVRHLPGGEQAMRDMVAELRREDGTGQELLGTEAYCSTRSLTDRQFATLLARVEARSKPPRRRKTSFADNVLWMATGQQIVYVRWMAEALGWSNEALTQFVQRQAKGKGKAIRTHDQASAVIEPMERMLTERGWKLTEGPHAKKWWDPPAEKVSA